MSTIKETLTERGEKYGAFKDNSEIAQRLKGVLNDWDGELSYSQKEAIEVIFQKISRILTGDPDYIDNWHDIQGYAKLIEDELTNKS